MGFPGGRSRVAKAHRIRRRRVKERTVVVAERAAADAVESQERSRDEISSVMREMLRVHDMMDTLGDGAFVDLAIWIATNRDMRRRRFLELYSFR